MTDRLWVALVTLTMACGGAEDSGIADWQALPEAGNGGQAVTPTVEPEAGAQQGGAAGTVAGSGGTTAGAISSAGKGGSESDAGAATGGSGSSLGGAGGQTQTGGAGAGGKGGGPSGGGGSGGAAVGPLEPKPAENCPGYVDVIVPVGTCLWVRGTFTNQNQNCNVYEPPENRCATVSATKSDLVSRFSKSAVIERFDFNESGCPKQCGSD